MQIAKNKVVSIDYTLTNADGTVLDSSKGHEPLPYLHGAGGIVPGLEQALEGKSVGDTLAVTIPPEKAYGPRNDQLIQDVPRSAFGDAKVESGMQFRAQGRNADGRMITVVSVEPETIRIDANHPLAGQTLHFDIRIIAVRDATKEEVEHRHVHGPGGHHAH